MEVFVRLAWLSRNVGLTALEPTISNMSSANVS